jgi:hypothetical protein
MGDKDGSGESDGEEEGAGQKNAENNGDNGRHRHQLAFERFI